MLEFYFSYRGVLRRLRSGVLGAEMDRIAGHAHCGSGPIGEAIVDSCLCTFTTDSPRIAAVSALQHERRVAPERFIASTPIVVDDPDAPLLSSFSDYLSRVRGLEPRFLRFLHWGGHHEQDLALLAIAAERAFLDGGVA